MHPFRLLARLHVIALSLAAFLPSPERPLERLERLARAMQAEERTRKAAEDRRNAG